MALVKSLPTSYGVPATYWRVVQTNLDWIGLTGLIALAGYASAEARAAGGAPLDQRVWAIPPAMQPLMVAMRDGTAQGSLHQVLYGAIKQGALLSEGAANEFADATDA